MTKTERQSSTIGVVPLRSNRSKFNEKFPEDIFNIKSVAKSTNFNTICIDPKSMTDDRVISTSAEIEAKKLRRHTWTLGIKSSLDIDDCNYFQGLNLERRRSSAPSTEETIEEVPDEEVEEEDNSTSFDYMKCKHCSQDGGKKDGAKTFPKDIKLDDINYCHNCKHLHQNKGIFGPSLAFDLGRRSSWAPGDKIRKELHRQSSSRGSIDLPAITEPDTDAQTVDETEEKVMQQRVQDELDKLIKYKSNSLERRKTIGCEKDIKDRLPFLKKFKVSRSDSEPGRERATLNIIRKNSVSSMRKHFFNQ